MTAPLAPRAALDGVAAAARAEFDARHAARERALSATRRIIQTSSRAIRATHRSERQEAAALLAVARAESADTQAVLAEHPEIAHSGFLHDAVKEYAEAALTHALVFGESLPTAADLGVDSAAYLHGLAEAAGELRRAALDALRAGDLARAERILVTMDDIYAVLASLDYPEAITRGLRRATDMVRGVSERTRGDLTIAALQERLQQKLDAVQQRLPGA